MLFEGQVLMTGEVPGTQQLREIGQWLDSQKRSPVIATACLATEAPQFAPLIPVASGLIATALSSTPGDYLVWVRPEQIQTLTWGGDPFKPIAIGNDPASLSPRRSFSQWHQLVEGTSESWSPAEMRAARLIGETVADVILQFRTVRMLIAQDQLEQVRRQVRRSDQPTVVADPEGRILLLNEAFERLLRTAHPQMQRIEDLATLFGDGEEVVQRLRELVSENRVWRGEVRVDTSGGPGRPLMVRGDPVFSSPDRVLGFVLLFTDITERKTAEAARQRFQDGIVRSNRC